MAAGDAAAVREHVALGGAEKARGCEDVRERGGGEGLGTLTAWKPRRLWRGTPTAVMSAVTSAALSGSPSTYM